MTEIEWSEVDALPFAFSISARAETDGQLLSDVSTALGNIVLADHGMTISEPRTLGPVPAPLSALASVRGTSCDHCDPAERVTVLPRFRPQLASHPLTQAAGHDPSRPAAEAMSWSMQEVRPSVHLTDNHSRRWNPRRDLLSSDASRAEFVIETESDGSSLIRFGDGENGRHPGEGTEFRVVCRTGNGVSGNVPSGALVHLVSDTISADEIESVSNPLAARGGVAGESLEEVRQNAPAAFRLQQRAVTPEDYAEKAALHPDVQRAAATLRWTGSWHTVFLSVDRRGGRAVDQSLENELREFLRRYRLAGQDLEIAGPRFVPLELKMQVCVADGYFRSHVISALQRTFDSRMHADGSRWFFHPDNLSFGQSVALSRISAAARRVAGVRHTTITMLRRLGATGGDSVPTSDVFTVGRLEIVQLENNPNFPDRGTLSFEALGGR